MRKPHGPDKNRDHAGWLVASVLRCFRALGGTGYQAPLETPNNQPDTQWIGLRENLQETMVFTIKYRGFL